MSQKIDSELVKKVAKLSRLELSDPEIAQFSDQLSAILEYVEKMNEVDTTAVEPLAHSLPISNCFRADVVKESLGTERTLANAPDMDDQYFKVPKILDDQSAS